MALHCTECGFVNTEGANYCQRCGALLPRAERHGGPITATYRIGETGELVPVELDRSPRTGRRWSSALAAGASARASRWTASA